LVRKRMNHPNVLSTEGVAPGLFEFCMVSQWMANGSVLDYVRRYTGVNRLELVRPTHRRSVSTLTGLQLIGVTRGLNYLHNNGVVHGDLKSVRAVYFVILLD